jgi:hypothetical protein
MKRLLQAGVCASQENRRVGRCQNVEWSGLCLVDQRITSLLAPWVLQGYTFCTAYDWRRVSSSAASCETALPRFHPFVLDVVALWLAVGRGEVANGRQIGWCPPLFTSMVRSFTSNLLYILRRFALVPPNVTIHHQQSGPHQQSSALNPLSDGSRSASSEQATDFRRNRVLQISQKTPHPSLSGTPVRAAPSPRGLWFHLSCSIPFAA